MKSPTRYSGLQIFFHWAIFVLFFANYIISDDMGRALRTFSQGGTPEGLTPVFHVNVGIAVLALTVLRLIVRLFRGAPALPEGGIPIMDKVAHWGHLALYALLLIVPLSGIATWFGGVKAAGEVHEVVVNLTLLVVIGHAIAALFHHFVLKDGLLNRMRPGQ